MLPRNPKSHFSLHTYNVRVLTVVGLVAFCLVALLGRMFYLQIIRADYFAERARHQQQSKITLEPRRGSIVDRQGRKLAVSVPVRSLYARPRDIDSPYVAAVRLAPLLGISRAELLKDLRSRRSFVWLKRQLQPQVATQIEQLDLPGLGFIEEYRRYYPNAELAGALLGFTGVDSQGLEGLEYQYQGLMAGEPEVFVVERDGTRRFIPHTLPGALRAGRYSLQLTIDSTLQHFTEAALRKGVNSSQADRGVAIVMHSQTGAILSMATYPSFDPNRFREFPRERYLNRAVTVGYEPGSTLKILTIAAALEEKLITPDQEFFCENGAYRFAGEDFHDTSPHDILNVEQIIQKSSNICAIKIGTMMSPEKFYEYIRSFGFGSRPESGLSGEAIGRVLPLQRWTRVDHASMSFGHGILVSPLQLISALNVFAADGKWVPPFIVEHAYTEDGDMLLEAQDEEGRTLQKFGPREPKQLITPQTARLLRRMMVSVTNPGGTAVEAAIPGYEVGGKTGTSQVFDEKTGRYTNRKHIAFFAGFVPATRPLFTVLVVVEHPRTSPYGGKVAGPVFKEIVRRSFLQNDILPDPDLMAEQGHPLR
jgi:cell division protein FtsI (penicillin-binding protein 3)